MREPRRAARSRAALGAVTLALLAGCGVSPERDPQPLPHPTPSVSAASCVQPAIPCRPPEPIS